MTFSIKLETADWSERTPTKGQLANHMSDLSNYLNKLAGSLLAMGEFTVSDQPMTAVLNAAGALRAASEGFGGRSGAGLIESRPQAVPMR